MGRDTGVFGRHLSRAFLKDEKQSLEGLAYQCKKPYPSGISVWQCQTGVCVRAAQSEVPLADVLRGHAYWDMILPSISPLNFLLEQLVVASSYHSGFLIGVDSFHSPRVSGHRKEQTKVRGHNGAHLPFLQLSFKIKTKQKNKNLCSYKRSSVG